MSDHLVFMMGEFEALFPTDRKYAKNHMWAMPQASPDGSDAFRFGFSAYAVRLLQDVYFLDWDLEAPAELSLKQEFGNIESKKAESSLYSPIAGKLTVFNDELLGDPSSINVDKYGAGWLFEMSGEGSELMTVDEYIGYLADVWEVTQRTIKGQLNE